MVKNLRAIQETQVPPLGQGRSPAGRKWQPTAVFLLGEFHGQRSLAGNSPQGHKELHTAEQLTLSLHFHTLTYHCIHTHTHTHTHTPQIYTNRHNGIVISYEKEGNPAICENVDGPWGRSIKVHHFMLSEISQVEKDKSCLMLLIFGILNKSGKKRHKSQIQSIRD